MQFLLFEMITVAEFTSSVRFSVHSSHRGLFLFWLILVVIRTFDGRGTLAISAQSEFIGNVFCLRDVIGFFVGQTEDHYFTLNELLLNKSEQLFNIDSPFWTFDSDSDLLICLDRFYW